MPLKEVCESCMKTVYEMEKLVINDKTYHKWCFKCSHCKGTLSLGNFASAEGQFFCKTHFMEKFREKGNYDDGFGRQKHSEKWRKA